MEFSAGTRRDKDVPVFRPFALLLVLAAALLATPSARAGLADDVDAVLADKYFAKVSVGVQIVALGEKPEQRQVIYARNADKPLIPASNLKIVTTSMAIERLGPDFKFRTTLAARTTPDGKVQLALIGDGDPSFGDLILYEKSGWTVDTVFTNWAAGLKQAGFGKVDQVLIDDSVFDTPAIHPNWPAGQQDAHYVAQVGGLSLNTNVVGLYLKPGEWGQRVDYAAVPPTNYIAVANTCERSEKNEVGLGRTPGTNNVKLWGTIPSANPEPLRITVNDPGLYAGTVLAETLKRNGLESPTTATRDNTVRQALKDNQGGWRVVAVHETPLEAVLGRTNKDSVNMYAESIAKRVAYAVNGKTATWPDATAAMGAFLQSLGVAATEFNLDDGCGLSRKNQIAPDALAHCYAHNFHGPNRKLFLDSLAVAGTDGTFDNRFKVGNLKGRVFGKSGYINGVSTVSGYLNARDGKWYCFVIMFNGMTNNATAKQMQDRIVAAIDANVQPSTTRTADGR
jgi:D-alanyl-D-alanine carboxypeptidase/D-alanyl-D-alanine-endopeptidase (penicillin-binding protein 4)